MQIAVRQIRGDDASSFRDGLDTVARERRFLAQVEALPRARMEEFVQHSVETGPAR